MGANEEEKSQPALNPSVMKKSGSRRSSISKTEKIQFPVCDKYPSHYICIPHF
jgi:hypothetical protein